MNSQKTQADHYYGATATQYEAKRANDKWEREHEAVQALLEFFPSGSTVLDIPCGTGRFQPIYQELELDACGMDVSGDMMALAQRRGLRTMKGDIRDIPFSDCAYDVAVCVRLLNWFSVKQMQQALVELARVTAGAVIVGVRTGPKGNRPGRRLIVHPEYVFRAAVEAAGLAIDEAHIHEIDRRDDTVYRIMRLHHVG